jgi:hypothetical protein
MDHEVVPRSCKICDWLLNLFRDHFSLHQGKKIRVTMKFEFPKRYFLRPTLSTDIVQWVLWWERQKRCSSRKRKGAMWNEVLLIYIWWIVFWGREDEDKRTVQLEILFKNCPFWTYIEGNQHIHFLCMVIPRWSTFGLHLVRGPKAL